ncbi:Rv3212 family protein [Mycolicibacterium gilvum]|uniref:Rv3212 family protein n=1 Tax=Mycolicibacterium gilvum TaxID=1804 RepID=UPI004045A853
MVKPERRTRADLVAAAAIAGVIVLVAAVVWWTSDARATRSTPAAEPLPSLKPAVAVPDSLTQLWTARSGETTRPLVVGGAVVTGVGQAMQGREPATGDVVWSYARDLDLCGVTWVYNYAVAVYPDARGCGQVSTVDAKTGRRGPARTSYADRHVTLSGDGSTVLSQGETRLEMWRSDMVRMLSYGALDAPIKPGVPATPLCRFVSAGASSDSVSVLEACESQDLRLTLLRPSDEEDSPEAKYVQQTGVADGTGARVVAVSDTYTALYVPTPKPRLDLIDDTGATVDTTIVDGPPSPEATMSKAGDLVTWWTGDALMVFSGNDLRYKYTVAATGPDAPVGPATIMAGKLLVPVTTGYDVFDPETGTGEKHIPVQRPPVDGPVVPAVAGTTVLELRGDDLVALG